MKVINQIIDDVEELYIIRVSKLWNLNSGFRTCVCSGCTIFTVIRKGGVNNKT